MVTSLSRLVEMMERGTIPAWLRDEITAKKAQIANALREGGEIALDGPNGERVSIRADKTGGCGVAEIVCASRTFFNSFLLSISSFPEAIFRTIFGWYVPPKNFVLLTS